MACAVRVKGVAGAVRSYGRAYRHLLRLGVFGWAVSLLPRPLSASTAPDQLYSHPPHSTLIRLPARPRFMACFFWRYLGSRTMSHCQTNSEHESDEKDQERSQAPFCAAVTQPKMKLPEVPYQVLLVLPLRSIILSTKPALEAVPDLLQTAGAGVNPQVKLTSSTSFGMRKSMRAGRVTPFLNALCIQATAVKFGVSYAVPVIRGH
jgi:hypothetical protein